MAEQVFRDATGKRDRDGLRANRGAAIAGGLFAAAAGLICLSYSAYGWAAFFLVIAALAVAGGFWYLSIDRSAPPRT